MEGADEARLQREQLDRYLAWVASEGGVDLPTHLDTMFRPEQIARMDWLKDHCEGSVLEAGCCYGLVLAYCGGQVGLDLNHHNIELARVLNPRKVFVQGNILKMPFPDAFTDTVMVPDCLEHLDPDNLRLALQETMRVCRKKALVTMPNAEYASRLASNFRHRFLLTEVKLLEVLNMLSAWNVRVDRTYHWTLLEITKR